MVFINIAISFINVIINIVVNKIIKTIIVVQCKEDATDFAITSYFTIINNFIY